MDIKCSWNCSRKSNIFTILKSSHALWILVHYETSYATEHLLEILFIQRAKDILGDDFSQGKMRVSLEFRKVGGKCMYSIIFSINVYMSWEAFKRPGPPKAITFSYPLTFTWWKIIISSKDRQRVENQPLWCQRDVGVWSPPAFKTAGLVKCTAAQSHISFDCQFVLCAAFSFELHLKMKANLVHSVHCCLLPLLICCRRHQGLQDNFFFSLFYSSEPCWNEHYA